MHRGRSGSQGESRGLFHFLSLTQMANLVFCHDFQAGANRKTQHWHERILESGAVHVITACARYQRSHSFITAKEGIQNEGFYLRARSDLFRCLSSPGIWSRADIILYEPAGKPAETDLMNLSVYSPVQRGGNWWQIDFVRYAEMLYALTNAPGILPGAPIELFRRKSFRDGLGAQISGVDFRDEAQRPSGQCEISRHGTSAMLPLR